MICKKSPGLVVDVVSCIFGHTYLESQSAFCTEQVVRIPSICVITERFLAYVTKEACKLHLVSRAVIFFSYLHIQKAKQVRRITLSNVIFCQKTKTKFVFGFEKIKMLASHSFSDKSWTNNLEIRKTLISELEDADSKVFFNLFIFYCLSF